MHRSILAAARPVWAAALMLGGALVACGESAVEDGRDRPAVSYESVAALRAEGAARFLTTDDALADLETAVAGLDSAGQAQARPLLDGLRRSRADLQAQLDSLDAERVSSAAAFDTLAADVRARLDALDQSIARDRVLVIPDAGALRAYASARLGALTDRAAALRADSTLRGIRDAAELDSARVRLERQAALLSRRDARFDSLRDVLAAGFSDLQRLHRDTLAMRFRPDSLR